MKLTIIAGARPNFIKIAPLIHAIEKNNIENSNPIEYRLVHTGQHYDKLMSDTFFEELQIPAPQINLNAGGGTQAEQTAAIMIAFEKELTVNPSDLVIVVGDVTSTMACSIVAKKLNTKVAHIEGGIRSFDLSMPEEINRMLTDSITDYFFTTSHTANENLAKIGVPENRIFFVGNIMIDTLLANSNKLKKPELFNQLQLKKKEYILLTMHRPANVDEDDKLKSFLQLITDNVQNRPVIFPIHPRTAKAIKSEDDFKENLHFVNPLGYLEFIYLVKHAKAVITDSGGITEETTVLGVPCMTLRDNTERPETIKLGSNVLVGTDPDKLLPYLEKLFDNNWKKSEIPELWDGKTAERIIDTLRLIWNH